MVPAVMAALLQTLVAHPKRRWMSPGGWCARSRRTGRSPSPWLEWDRFSFRRHLRRGHLSRRTAGGHGASTPGTGTKRVLAGDTGWDPGPAASPDRRW